MVLVLYLYTNLNYWLKRAIQDEDKEKLQVLWIWPLSSWWVFLDALVFHDLDTSNSDLQWV